MGVCGCVWVCVCVCVNVGPDLASIIHNTGKHYYMIISKQLIIRVSL